MRKTIRMLALASTLGLVAAACGEDADDVRHDVGHQEDDDPGGHQGEQ